jgi:hypothetical protein
VARSSFTGPIRPVGPAQKLEEAFTEAPERFDNENHNVSPALMELTVSPSGRRSRFCAMHLSRPRNIVPSCEWQAQAPRVPGILAIKQTSLQTSKCAISGGFAHATRSPGARKRPIALNEYIVLVYITLTAKSCRSSKKSLPSLRA